ncbi:MAG: hypothetical protein D6731_07960 [Planctomycetota bacterium]|nr:MAG: hypothetical protein D6731_07960 [Planctomycetota bacterium]
MPPPATPFVWGLRLAALGLLAAALAAPGHLPPWIAAVVAAVSVLALLRVPRRLRACEVALGYLVLATHAPLLLLTLPALASALLCLLAPEADLAPLNGLDRFMIVQEYPGMAVNSHHILDTDRPLDRRALTAAVDSLLRDVPLLRSFVREGPLGAERFAAKRPWVDAHALIAWNEDPRADDGFQEPFALEALPPWRLRVRPLPQGGWRTVLSVHHSLCDGAGQVALFEGLMGRYADFLAGERPRPVPALLRAAPRLRALLWPRGPRWLWRMIRRHVRPSAKVGVVHASLLDDEGAEPGPVAYRIRSYEPAEVEGFWRAAKRYRATRNHLYVAASLRAALAWRRARGLPERAFRLLVPAHLRGLFDLDVGLGNCSGVINLDAAPETIDGDSSELLASIARQLRKARDLEEAIEAPLNLGVTSALLPLPLFRRALRDFDADPNSFFFSYGYTAVDFPPGLAYPRDVEVRRMWMLGSPARHPGVGLGPVRDRGRTHMVLGFRRGGLSEEGADDFLRRFDAALAELVAQAPKRPRRGSRPADDGSA